jgi:stress-induced morphogen
MKSNNARQIQNLLKEIFKPTHIEVEDSTLVSKKFKVLIVSSKFSNKSNSGIDNDKEVYQALKEKIKIQKPVVEELDIATYTPSNFDANTPSTFKTYKYYDMLPNFSQRMDVL